MLRRFLERAAEAGISTWLGAVVSMYPVSSVKAEPSMTITEMCGTPMPFPVGVFDADTPEVTTFAVAIFDELRALFPMAGGFLVELELADRAMAHRIPLYDRWADQNGRPHFAGLTARPHGPVRGRLAVARLHHREPHPGPAGGRVARCARRDSRGVSRSSAKPAGAATRSSRR